MAKITAAVHQIAGKRFVGTVPDGPPVMIDGEGDPRTGMRPMELLLNAVGACAAYDIVEMIRKRRIELRSYRIELEGVRADGTPAYYTSINMRHIIDAPGLDRETAERFVDLGVNKYCSVGASLRSEMEFEVILEHEEDLVEAG